MMICLTEAKCESINGVLPVNLFHVKFEVKAGERVGMAPGRKLYTKPTKPQISRLKAFY